MYGTTTAAAADVDVETRRRQECLASSRVLDGSFDGAYLYPTGLVLRQ